LPGRSCLTIIPGIGEFFAVLLAVEIDEVSRLSGPQIEVELLGRRENDISGTHDGRHTRKAV
jgi:hypothetical protein